MGNWAKFASYLLFLRALLGVLLSLHWEWVRPRGCAYVCESPAAETSFFVELRSCNRAVWRCPDSVPCGACHLQLTHCGMDKDGGTPNKMSFLHGYRGGSNHHMRYLYQKTLHFEESCDNLQLIWVGCCIIGTWRHPTTNMIEYPCIILGRGSVLI